MSLKVASRGQIPPFIVMEVMRAANAREAAGKAVYHLEVGQPGTGAPQGVIRAAQAALVDQRLGYTEALGTTELRQAIVGHYKSFYGIRIDIEQVVATTGSSAGFVLAFLSAFDPSDRVALASPSYPCYRNTLSALGVEPILLPCGTEERFQPTPALLDRARAEGPLHGLIVASPSNPAGTMLKGGQLEELCHYCREYDIRLISDEIYHGISYEEPATSALAFADDAIVVNSFSKYFSMTGWRIGWMVMPKDLARSIECISQSVYISPPTLSQVAGVAAFQCREELDANVARYADNRKLLLHELPKAGFERLAPADGAFYIYADVSAITDDSEAYCRALLDRTGVAATPGVDFDPEQGKRFIRFSFAGGADEIASAAKALVADHAMRRNA
jgi:aspartate/methionine/tyrosine aminotransferase